MRNTIPDIYNKMFDESVSAHDHLSFGPTIDIKNAHEILGIRISQSDKYYICKHCGKLVTDYQRMNDIRNGGMGLCNCDYVSHVWNSITKKFDVVFNKIYYDYEEIPYNIYVEFKKHSTYERIKMYNSYIRGGK
jgi:hypothetical protein